MVICVQYSVLWAVKHCIIVKEASDCLEAFGSHSGKNFFWYCVALQPRRIHYSVEICVLVQIFYN
jgi:hypothetical protein